MCPPTWGSLQPCRIRSFHVNNVHGAYCYEEAVFLIAERGFIVADTQFARIS